MKTAPTASYRLSPCAVRAGAYLAPDRAVGRRTWEEFLAHQVSSSGDDRSRAA